MLARYDAAALLALFEPWPVIGSLSTTASASPSTSAPDGSSPTGLRTVGGNRPARTPFVVGELDLPAALGLPGQERLEHPLAPLEMLLRRRHVAPAVHRPAGDALEDHDLARARRGERREDEVLADGRDQVEADGRELGARLHPGHVGERERALRRTVRRTGRVALEQLRDLAFAGGDDDEVVLLGVAIEVGDRDVVQDDGAALLLELLHPERDLQALVDRLRRPLEARGPVDHLPAFRAGDGKRDAFDVRGTRPPRS